jgi:polyhydroxyalkanoate synthesis repressor PhaR
MKLIKRYTNRKLYDTERSSYVTLEEIADMVRAGEEVRIVDNRTGEDLTTVTMAQIVYEEEKKAKRVLPLHSFRMIIQQPTEFMQRLSRPMVEFREQTQQQFERLKKRAEAQQEEILLPIREFLEGLQRNIEELQDSVDERIRDSMDALTHVPDVANELAQLRARTAELEKKLRRLERELSKAKRTSDPFGPNDLP